MSPGIDWIFLLHVFLSLIQYGRTPLHLAANNGSLEVVRHLCLAGANTDAVTNVSHHAYFFMTRLCLSATAGKCEHLHLSETQYSILTVQLIMLYKVV